MNTATHLNTRRNPDNSTENLWRLNPPHDGHEYVVTYALTINYAPRVCPVTGTMQDPEPPLTAVYCFPSDAAGTVDEDAHAIPGTGIRRSLDHSAPIAQLGYEIALGVPA